MGQKERPVYCTETGAGRAQSFPCSFPGPDSGQGDRTWGHNKSSEVCLCPVLFSREDPELRSCRQTCFALKGTHSPSRWYHVGTQQNGPRQAAAEVQGHRAVSGNQSLTWVRSRLFNQTHCPLLSGPLSAAPPHPC